MSENTVEETSAPIMFTLNFSEEELNLQTCGSCLTYK